MHYVENENCPICKNSFESNVYAREPECEYQTVDDEFQMHRCRHCHTIIMNPRPSEKDLQIIYPENYYAFNEVTDASPSRIQAFSSSLFRKVRERNLKKTILKHIKIPADRNLRVLDIGCVNGIQLDAIKDLYPDAETCGIDFDSRAINIIQKNGHKGHVGKFEEADLNLDYFDLVLSMHVIEHVAEPDLFVSKALELLNTEGALVLATPNTDCVDFQIFGKHHWGEYHKPRHWYLFEKKSFDFLVERLDCNLIEFQVYILSSFWVISFHSLFKKFLGKT